MFTPATTPGGIIQAPTDYEHLLSIRATSQDANGINRVRPVPLLNSDEVADRYDSSFMAPTLQDPVCQLVQDSNVQIHPNTGISGYMEYLSRPVTPVFVYTQTGRNIVYDKAGSTQMEWADPQILSIIMKVLSFLGINSREQDVVQYSETKDMSNFSSTDKL
jgi:hypothetical protein